MSRLLIKLRHAPEDEIQEIRSLPGPVWTLSAGIFVDRFGTFVFPFLVLFLTAEGMGNELAGVAAGLGV